MTAARRLTSLQMAGFVADGYLRFDGIVPRALVRRGAGRAGGAAARPRRSAPRPTARPPAGRGGRWPGSSATGRRSAAVLELPAVAAVIESLLGDRTRSTTTTTRT